MTKIEMFKKAISMSEIEKNVELTGVLKDLYTDHLELLEKNNELKSKLQEIGDVAQIKKDAKVQSGFYTLKGVEDINGKEICFCLNCLYEHSLQIPMVYGLIERGSQDYFSGDVITPNIFGISCKKCGTNLVVPKCNDDNK